MPKVNEDARRRALASLSEMTPEEEARINAGIAQDADNPELDDAWFERAGRPERRCRRRSGRRQRKIC